MTVKIKLDLSSTPELFNLTYRNEKTTVVAVVSSTGPKGPERRHMHASLLDILEDNGFFGKCDVSEPRVI